LNSNREAPGWNREGTALQIPARSGPGGEGEVRGKKEEVPAHLLVVLARWEMVERMVVGGEGRSLSGEGVLVARGFWWLSLAVLGSLSTTMQCGT